MGFRKPKNKALERKVQAELRRELSRAHLNNIAFAMFIIELNAADTEAVTAVYKNEATPEQIEQFEAVKRRRGPIIHQLFDTLYGREHWQALLGMKGGGAAPLFDRLSKLIRPPD